MNQKLLFSAALAAALAGAMSAPLAHAGGKKKMLWHFPGWR
ncbi:hypothetical protein [Marinobacter sp. MMG032]|uniref:Uncharacterized protein n=1 Tax=Marinobacter sp. MMG032 TaxID=3158548 RepID=A0AAU7MNK3_9GAMM